MQKSLLTINIGQEDLDSFAFSILLLDTYCQLASYEHHKIAG